MSIILRILLGLIVALGGVFQIASAPYAGSAAVLLGGMMILEAINRLFFDGIR
jgi:hypothetical protein